ncbi:OmpH family outer membrane protein [Desulfosediminicola flagellatus]|uniref:OmpH family outer membrane protein n=1 Tax=Desulfosediminicola flagellatus TaxID=2569541 RepID=UPI0010AC9316|nr:OmpH family outer membrane protein [Desulfosediminicola flagellatus]
MTLKKWMVALALLSAVTIAGAGTALAESKIGVINGQKILSLCDAGQTLKGQLETRMKELQSSFKAEDDTIVALQQEIEKKSSAWSEDKTKEKVAELRKKRRDMQLRNEDAKNELQQMQDKAVKPILESLQDVVAAYGKKNGYTAILDVKAGVVYFDNAAELSEAIVKELNVVMAKK